MLRQIGMDELIADDREQLIETVVRIAQNVELRRALGERIELGHERLFDRQEPLSALERVLLDLAKA